MACAFLSKTPMKMKINVPEVCGLIKQIPQQPEGLFEMIRADVRETVGEYLSELMDVELTHFLCVIEAEGHGVFRSIQTLR
jgi:hypothetical protein